VIRVAVVDDQHAVRLGLASALKSEPGMVPVGVAASALQTDTPAIRRRSRRMLADLLASVPGSVPAVS
jgi:DNA-binding NarL/FixJ family response regulator